MKIWEDELGVRPIGIQENFFELGGHSLLAVRVFAQLRRTLDLELPLATFLRQHGAETVVVAELDYVFARDNPLYEKLAAKI